MADAAPICLLRAVQALESLLRTFGRRGSARWWLGKAPQGRKGQLPRLIAAKVGYPTAAEDPFEGHGLIRLNDGQAAHVLAVAGTVGLAYRFRAPRPTWLNEAKQALRDLGEDHSFFSNGLWEADGARSFTSLTSATFDCGLIGFDAEYAFIFWTEDED
jgi:hypothetical protein